MAAELKIKPLIVLFIVFNYWYEIEYLTHNAYLM